MADYTSTHTGAEIDAGITKTETLSGTNTGDQDLSGLVANQPLETGENSLVKAVYMTKSAYTALPSKVATTLYIISGA